MASPQRNMKAIHPTPRVSAAPRTRGLCRALGLALLLAPASGGLGGCALLRSAPVVYEPRTLPSGVVALDLAVPDKGPVATEGDRVAIEYDLFLVDGASDDDLAGNLVDSTSQRGRPARFELGAGEVPRGVEEGVLGMRLFGQRRLIVPPEAGYGAEGLPPRIPPHATLRFEVELVEITPRDDPPDAGDRDAPPEPSSAP